MNNFINVRVKSYNNTKQYNIIKHNLRKIESLSQIKEDLLESGPLNEKENHQEKGNLLIMGDAILPLEDKGLRDLFYKNLSKDYQNDRAKHNEAYKKKWTANLRDRNATWLEGVFTFSEQIKSDLGNKYTLVELIEVAKNCLEDIAKKLNSEIKYMVFHNDETTPHFHYALKNFDDNGMSLFHKINNKDSLSELQDIGFAHFGALGMQRGIKKELKGLDNVNHQTIKAYHERQLNQLRKEISFNTTKLDNMRFDISEASKVLDLKTIQNNYVNAFLSDKNITSQ